jgi:hypothetical protein
MKPSPLSLLVPAALTVTVLCTVLVRGGWLLWIPTLLALGVVGFLASSIRR